MSTGACATTFGAEERLAADGDESIHDQLVALMDRYELPLYKFLYVILGDGDTATDCAQDTFVRAYDNLRRGKSVNAGWLYTVARNRAMDEFRRRRQEEPALERLRRMTGSESASPEAGAAMREAFAQLPPDDRTILYLSAVEGWSGGEIAAMLGINPTAARMRICRARERFRLAYGTCT